MPAFIVLGLSFLLLHELDAIRAQEWRLFVGLRALPEPQAYRLFTALHLPIFVGLIWSLPHNIGVQIGFDLFLIGHVGAHVLFRRHPNYLFDGWFAWIWIVGAGLCGICDLLRFML